MAIFPRSPEDELDRRDGEDRRAPVADENPQLRIRWSIAVQVIVWIVGLFIIYNTMTARLTTLETNRQNDTMRMERMENKLDRLLERKE